MHVSKPSVCLTTQCVFWICVHQLAAHALLDLQPHPCTSLPALSTSSLRSPPLTFKVLDGDGEKGVSKAELKRRGEALKRIGSIFQHTLASGSVVAMATRPADAEAAREAMQAAMLAAQDKAAGFSTEEA
eukprot:364203-Chlamydomonas_euryale.AAC.4